MSLPPIDPRRARDIVAGFPGLRVLVVGDVMIDRFLVGRVTRVSQEAPVPIVRFQSEDARLGGAANVAHNLAALGAHVSLVGLVGLDPAAQRVRELLLGSGIATDGLVEDRSRRTTEKVRIVTERNQQVARIDYEEDADAEGDLERRLLESIEHVGRDTVVMLISDYLKGTVTRSVVQALVARTHTGAPLVIDPKIPHLGYYAGATVVTPNHVEAEAATHRRILCDDDAREAALDFRDRAQCEAALITRGEHGMWLSSGVGEGPISSTAREVSDVTGAGDTVVATLALALAARATLAEAARLANSAAGIVVGKFGPATLTSEELLTALSAT